MKNINYFCSVKRIGLILTNALILTLTLLSGSMSAQPLSGDKHAAPQTLEISLLTCAPGQAVYSLYGHTAIKVKFLSGNDSTASCTADRQAAIANYGMFSFRKPFFVLRFVFGLTDYELGMTDESSFCEEYRWQGRYVVEQTLNLTEEEKEEIWRELMINYMPENRTYRYNYFYDNCTTRARDILTRYIKGRVVYQGSDSVYPSYREMIHQMNTDYPWARFGNDMLLGVKADKTTDLGGHQFLPFNLMDDFAKAKIVGNDGSVRPLVKSTTTLVDATAIQNDGGFPLRPIACAWLLFAIVAVATCVEWRLRVNLWLFDAVLLTVVGLAGIILFLMIFSEHPTTSLNLQLLLLNPLPLVFMYRIVKRMRRGQADRTLWGCAVALTCLFFVGGALQSYAEGMYVVALALLTRYLRRLRTPNNQTKITKR